MTAPPTGRHSGVGQADWVLLNIGGKVFRTTRTTLCSRPDCIFAKIFAGDPAFSSTQDENGAFLFDRDPDYFVPILNFLRHGKLIINPGVAQEGVLEEAEFYGVLPIISILKPQVEVAQREKESEKSKHVYRVFESNEEELTQMMSSLSDGWRFEQLTHVSSGYSYGGEEKNEFVVVVSKKVPVENESENSRRCDKHDRW